LTVLGRQWLPIPPTGVRSRQCSVLLPSGRFGRIDKARSKASQQQGVDFHFAGRWSLQAKGLEGRIDVFEMNVERAKTIDFRR